MESNTSPTTPPRNCKCYMRNLQPGSDNKIIQYKVKYSDFIDDFIKEDVINIDTTVYDEHDDTISMYNTKDFKYIPINYMDAQTGMNPIMRAFLIDWLINAHRFLFLEHRTLYLATNIIDRFLSKAVVAKQRFGLLAISALFLASKYEEVTQPLLDDFLKITKYRCQRHDVIIMESIILQIINFDLGTISSCDYLNHYFENHECSNLQKHIADYLSVLSLMDYDQIAFKPSDIACSCILLAKSITNCDKSRDVLYVFKKTESELEMCTNAISHYLKEISSQKRNNMTKPLLSAIRKYEGDDTLYAVKVCAEYVCKI